MTDRPEELAAAPDQGGRFVDPNEPGTTEPPNVRSSDPLSVASSLASDPSFWGMVTTQFLGAFNDNLFKQLVLLLAVGHAAQQGQAGKGSWDVQSLALVVFSAPFLLFSGYAGFLSERYSKRKVIVICKVAEVLIVFLGMVAFWSWNVTGISGLLVVLFLMGAHSAFFGPSKYGILPELFRERNLPKVNGVVLMTTFLAIIFGVALAGSLKDLWGEAHLWRVSLVCLVIAMLGTLTALFVRKIPAADSSLPLEWSSLTVPRKMVRYLQRDRMLLLALAASCMFWLIGGIVQPTVNAVGVKQFAVSDTKTSYLAAAMGVGIALGCIMAGFLSRNRINFTIMRWGSWMIVASLAALSVPGRGQLNWLGYSGTLLMLILLGAAAGLFVVPLQVFIQARPPASLKGRTIATMNLTNWIAIVFSAVLYFVFDQVVEKLGWRRTACFGFLAVLMLPVALLYKPQLDGVHANEVQCPQ